MSEMIDLLSYWIREREAVRVKKEAGKPKPWSDDPVFQTVYFCNVRREDDRVTRWIRKNYTPKVMGENYELAMCVARIFNRPETLAAIKPDVAMGRLSRVYGTLNNRLSRGEQVWSGAYLISTNGKKMDKLEYCINMLEDMKKLLKSMHHRELPGRSCQEYYQFIMKADGFGSFLAAQVVADLKNTKDHPLADAADWYTFSAPGPGSLRGLGWVLGGTITPASYQDAIVKVHRALPKDVQELYRGNMQDLQNCLCEFDKMMRVRTGTGRSKRKYPGVARER